MATRIDGKRISAEIREEIRQEGAAFAAAQGFVPGLAVVIVGDNPASQVYVRNKKKACEEVGFYSEVHALPADTTQEQLNALVDRLNGDDRIHGILVQLPLPAHLDETEVLLRIRPDKDVDAFHPYNVGKIMIGNPDFLPCTPAGVMALLERSGEEWIDELPISESAPYTFTGTDAEVAALKSFAGVNDYADADEVMHWNKANKR